MLDVVEGFAGALGEGGGGGEQEPVAVVAGQESSLRKDAVLPVGQQGRVERGDAPHE